jgi:hypothetical protein
VLQLEKWTKQCAVENKTMKLTLYLAEDVVQYIDISNLPENITVFEGIPPEFCIG